MNRILAIVLGCALVFSNSFAGVNVVSYFGGSGDDAVSSVAFALDGSIILCGTSTSPTISGQAGTRLAAGNGFVAKLNGTGSTLEWLVRLSVPKKVHVNSQGAIYVLLDSSLAIIAANGSAFTRQGTNLGAVTVDMSVAPNGCAAILAGGNAHFIEVGGSERWNTTIGRDHPWAIAINPITMDVWVGGDQNTNTGYEPWRSPFLYQYSATTGNRISALWNWPGPAVRANGLQLQADSYIKFLKFSSTGTLWMGAGSDGGNTVLTKEPDSLNVDQDALAGTCFSGPCFGYKGAKSTGMFGRMKSDASDLEKASWVIPYVGMNPGSHVNPPCGCKGPDFQGIGVNPGSFGVTSLIPTDSGVIVLGNPWGKGPATTNGWYYNTVYTSGGIGWIGVFTNDLSQITQASMIPGSRSVYGDYQNGRLVAAGKAINLSTTTLDTAEAGWNISLPTTQSALQKNYNGGASDGYFILACMSNDQQCNNSASINPQTQHKSNLTTGRSPIFTGKGLSLEKRSAKGMYSVTTLVGAVVKSGTIPSDGFITFTSVKAGGILIVRVTRLGETMTWRIAAVR